MMHISNTTLVNVFENQTAKDATLTAANVIYYSYFTPKRISEFKKLKVVESKA